MDTTGEAQAGLAQVQKEQELEERLASLKKELEASFNKPTGSASSAAPPAASLKKEEALKKPEALNKGSAAESSLKKVDRPLVIIDWHNTLEKGDALPEENLEALKKVLDVADVRIISWVGSQGPAGDLEGYQTVWYRCGEWIGHATTRLRPCLMTIPVFVRKRGIGAWCLLQLLHQSHTLAAPFGLLLRLPSHT